MKMTLIEKIQEKKGACLAGNGHQHSFRPGTAFHGSIDGSMVEVGLETKSPSAWRLESGGADASRRLMQTRCYLSSNSSLTRATRTRQTSLRCRARDISTGRDSVISAANPTDVTAEETTVSSVCRTDLGGRRIRRRQIRPTPPRK